MEGLILTGKDGAEMESTTVQRLTANSFTVHSVMRTRFLLVNLRLVLLDLRLAIYHMAELESMIALLMEVSCFNSQRSLAEDFSTRYCIYL